MHRKEHEKFSAGDVRRVSAGRCSSRKLRTGWMAGLCLFGMFLFLTGCGKNPAQAGPKPSGGTTSKVESTDKSTSALPEDIDFTALDEDKKEQLLKTLVQDSYTFEGEVNDGPADRTDVSYHVPKICSDSAGAKEINQAIAQACEDVTSQKEDDYVGWIEVDYDSYLNGDTLSLVLTKSSNLDDYTEYYAYNLNLTDGTRM